MADAPDPVPEFGSDYDPFGLGPAGSGDSTPAPGIRRVNFRAVIDTNPPFGSVKEAVTRFGGSGPWIPFCKGIEQFDIKRMEEQTAELEKDLIVKELETLDVLEELGATKRMVEDLKRQLRTEALKCFQVSNSHSEEQSPSPTVKEIQESFGDIINNHEHILRDSCPSPDMILMELKQAKMNLGKTINDLGVIQTSVESLNRKMKKEKSLLAKRRDGAPPKFSRRSTLDEEVQPIQVKSQVESNDVEFKDVSENSFNTPQLSPMAGQMRNQDRVKSDYLVGLAENEHTRNSLRTAELRLLAARKMEEAAKAAEAVALAEFEALSNIDNSNGFSLQEPDTVVFNFKEQSLLNSNTQKQNEEVMAQFDEANSSKLAIAKKLKEAKEELNLGKKALEEALNRVELANKKQLVAEETLRRWVPEHKGPAFYYPSALNNFRPSALANFCPSARQGSPLHSMSRPDLVNKDSKPVIRSNISMRDVLGRKQGLSSENIARRDSQSEKQKVALSQMLHLHALREDLTFPSKTDKDRNEQKNHTTTEKKRFGFIHIALPMMKQSKKKPQS